MKQEAEKQGGAPNEEENGITTDRRYEGQITPRLFDTTLGNCIIFYFPKIIIHNTYKCLHIHIYICMHTQRYIRGVCMCVGVAVL